MIEKIIKDMEEMGYGGVVKKTFERNDVKELINEYNNAERIKKVIIEAIGYLSIHNKTDDLIYAFKKYKNELIDLYSKNEDEAVIKAWRIVDEIT